MIQSLNVNLFMNSPKLIEDKYFNTDSEKSIELPIAVFLKDNGV